MKKFLLFPLLVFMTAIILPACSDDNKESTPKDPTTIKYSGKLLVNGNYEINDAICEIIYEDASLTLKMFDVKFAEAMHGTIDMTVPGIMCRTSEDKIIFSGADIIPLVGVVPTSTYKLSNIDGYIENSELTFSASLIRGTFTFRGQEVVE